ncbi:MAG: hypothetical protein ACM359_12895 [Bacillota bacterium]
MNPVRSNRILFCHAVILVAMLLTASSLHAQDASQGDDTGLGQLYTSSSPIAIPEGQKIIPVRVLREFELGSILERFAATTNCLLERHEKEMTDVVWKVSPGISITPVAIVVRDAIEPANRRLGARFDYLAKADSTPGAKEDRSSHIVDMDELKQLEIVFNAMIKALDQSPARNEVIALQYKSRSGFAVSLTLAQKGGDQTITATLDKVTCNSKDKARTLFEESTTMVRTLMNHLAAY